MKSETSSAGTLEYDFVIYSNGEMARGRGGVKEVEREEGKQLKKRRKTTPWWGGWQEGLQKRWEKEYRVCVSV